MITNQQHTYELLPAILEKEWSEIEKKLQIVKPFAKSIHIDFIDGKFANNTTFMDFQKFKPFANDFILEAHLMVEEPLQYVKPLADAGFQRFIGHIEKMSDQVAFVADTELLGEVGFALDGKTPVDAINVPLTDIDSILVMCINAGFAGQNFTAQLLEKITTLKNKSFDGAIEVDGGINDKTLLLAKDKGANRFAMNSFLFKSEHPEKTYLTLQKNLN